MGVKVVNIVKSMYENTKAVYRLGELETRPVKSVKGGYDRVAPCHPPCLVSTLKSLL